MRRVRTRDKPCWRQTTAKLVRIAAHVHPEEQAVGVGVAKISIPASSKPLARRGAPFGQALTQALGVVRR